MEQASPLVAFYRGGPDASGRRLAEILEWDSVTLEFTHDYIQWLFPLRERSGANPTAPVLSQEDVNLFRRDPALQQRMIDALDTMWAFYGFGTNRPLGWVSPRNHNYLRLTRILRSLRTIGLEAQAGRLFAALTELYRRHQLSIGATTYAYWERAMTDDL